MLLFLCTTIANQIICPLTSFGLNVLQLCKDSAKIKPGSVSSSVCIPASFSNLSTTTSSSDNLQEILEDNIGQNSSTSVEHPQF